ncbi:MAG: hemolysin III family protein, partial [Flavobacterium sp.]|nr:hemolysin III family protein [Flavobacterium sp.]
SFLIGIWVVAAIGVARKVFFKVKKRSLLSTMSYIFMGCSVLFVVDELYRNLPIEALYWLLGGGFFYIGGTYFYQANKPFIAGVFGYHAIWHLFVFGGAACHYVFIYMFLV